MIAGSHDTWIQFEELCLFASKETLVRRVPPPVPLKTCVEESSSSSSSSMYLSAARWQRPQSASCLPADKKHMTRRVYTCRHGLYAHRHSLGVAPGSLSGSVPKRKSPPLLRGFRKPISLINTMDNTDVEQVTLALLDAANDKDSEVQDQVRKSMLTLGKQQPDRVLAMCQDYLLKNPKLVVSHRVVILQTIKLIVGCRIEEISAPRIKSIISLASDEMTRSKEVIPDWQQAASNILVAVGNKHINDIMEEILSKFQPGVLPHFFVVQTLANLSDSNGEKQKGKKHLNL
ncbi:hypothetical protein AMECASPLE_011400 [Ameca splendens]|uniref:MROH2B-like N-terminal HEAT-repeats domain-containing protein n=1 Tax=Ameca splendens TaxID=208324 RepID=A0ABV0Z057_9TELE